jgi:hypothetical protein
MSLLYLYNGSLPEPHTWLASLLRIKYLSPKPLTVSCLREPDLSLIFLCPLTNTWSCCCLCYVALRAETIISSLIFDNRRKHQSDTFPEAIALGTRKNRIIVVKMKGNGNVEREDFDESTWISLLGLLHPCDAFVTVDNTALWRSHIAWAKPKGKEIKDYTTQRFATNMVFLSLLLGADMNVLFNSATFSAEIRRAMMEEEYGSLRFYIGCTLLLGAIIAVLGLVTTFTAWGMISAISDSNSHCLLRSSMGQYVTSLPSRFVVAALYLFLLWLFLFILELMSGPCRVIMISLVGYLFFQVIVSMSAFGRLIINTGAMGSKRVLDPEFERHLLPSGLHASLLIKATERLRRKTSVTAQYKTPQHAETQGRGFSSSNSSTLQRRSNTDSSQLSNASGDINYEYGSNTAPRMSSEEEESIHNIAKIFSGVDELKGSPRSDEMKDDSQGSKSRGHRRDLSTESMDSVDEMVKGINFPRPSVLNRVASTDLKAVLEMTLSQSNRGVTPATGNEEGKFELPVPPIEDDAPHTQIREMARRRSAAVMQKQSSLKVLQDEWEEEEDVRDMYDITPPVSLWDFDNDPDFESDMHTMPRASLLNRRRGLGSLRTLVARHDSGKMNMEQIEEESSPSANLVMEESSEKCDIFDSNTNSSTDEELGLDNEEAGSERQHLLVKATRNMFRGKGNQRGKKY